MAAFVNPYDVALREQLFYGGLRQGEADKADDYTDELIVAVIGVLAALGITTFEGMTRAKFNSLLKRIVTQLTIILDRTQTEILSSLKTVMGVVLQVGKSNSALLSNKPASVITDKAFNGRFGGNLRLWKQLTDDYIPGSGLTPIELVGDFARATKNNIVLAVKRAWASNAPLTELVKQIRGTPEKKFKDGIANKINNQFRAASDTLMQYIKCWIMNKIGSFFYDRYQWVSTMDDRTTDYCINHHLKIYEYGRGPIPPAHYRCRSTTVGIDGNPSNMAPDNFNSWFESQPNSFIENIITTEDKNKLANGEAFDPGAYKNLRAITAAEYLRRLPDMQLPTDED